MEATAYATESALEADHWWFVGRRRLFRRLIEGTAIDRSACVLDVGTGTGANLRLMADMGFKNVLGLDASMQAAQLCRAKGFAPVWLGDAKALPFANDAFDLVLATDVIEHLPDDVGTMREIRRVLRPGGRAIVTVPAFQSLWGLQDEVAHHLRRYRRAPFEAVLKKAGLKLEKCFYFNFILFPAIFVARRLIRLFARDVESENTVTGSLTNALLKSVFALDVVVAEWLKPPFGVSILAVGRKEDQE